ncbi:MAG: hypothetical protein JRG73_11045 [Deltaproteobacteria bacterium]|nr:hypothetical protein [Deltaproteobacteria bacterium]MBW2307460.1 hypothetical protein [Deltaproteobacteria bacterium]
MLRWKVARIFVLMMICSLPVTLFAGGAQQKVLSQEDVDRVLKVYPDYVRWIKQSAPRFKVEGTRRNPNVWLLVGIFQKGAADYIQRQGWNFQDFSVTAGSLFLAYLHLESGLGAKGSEGSKKEGRQKSALPGDKQDSSNIDRALKEVPAGQGPRKLPKVPETNLDLARKNLDRIRAMLATLR